MRFVLPAALALLTVTACATPQNQVQTALVQAGLRPQIAACMAERMTDRLSIAQLQKLSRAKGQPGEKLTDLSAADFVERARRIDDPEVVRVASAAAVGCTLGT
jgi:hypothetical protein